jgi:hypothetical protein
VQGIEITGNHLPIQLLFAKKGLGNLAEGDGFENPKQSLVNQKEFTKLI